MERIHDLKTYPGCYKEIVDGRKKCEIRINDRNFAVGDVLLLQEYCPDSGFTGQYLSVKVTHIVPGGQFSVPEECVLMSIEPVTEPMSKYRSIMVTVRANASIPEEATNEQVQEYLEYEFEMLTSASENNPCVKSSCIVNVQCVDFE